ncbi:MAG: hypothetical protein ACC628_17680, partial [Pirellulaceae bacterium]
MMEKFQQSPEGAQDIERVLGYLNFSSGGPDPKFLASLNRLWKELSGRESTAATWRVVGDFLRDRLQALTVSSAAFQDAGQASTALEIVWNVVLPGYLDFHQDLFFHQKEEVLYNPFFVGRACEAVLRQGQPWEEADRICQVAIAHLNDYVGYRPVAVLESRRIEPYPHERVRPVPLYIRDAGVATGRYQAVVENALELLRSTDEDLLQIACFDPASLDELAFDPRAYDFDHPANKRPNYHFGLWDPYHLDNQGRYRRFVVQQVTLDALMERLDSAGDLPFHEVLLEAASVLAGTILMASGVSGRGPDTYDSTVTLANLLPRIASYRDLFYERLIEQMEPAHGARLRIEAKERRQPFGGARQRLNSQLARRRASQLEHVQLAKIFARMGYPEASAEQAAAVPVASARMICQIECRLTTAEHALGERDPERAATLLTEMVARLQRGIQCGAVVDPWNILGFDAQFSLFPALENSVHDHRVDELVELVEHIFGIYARAWSEAASQDRVELCDGISREFRDLADWWRQFAAHEVTQIEAIDAHDAYHAAAHVTRALNLWHKEGASTGDIGFWAPHAEMFDSPQAYALVVEALLDQSDLVAAMGLLVHWLAAAELIPLEQGESSFHRLSERWLLQLRGTAEAAKDAEPAVAGTIRADQWRRIRRFFDYIEANAGTFWEVPSWEIGDLPMRRQDASRYDNETPIPDEDACDDDEEEDLFRAAYEDVVYQDSANDGIDGEVYDTGNASGDELLVAADRISERLAFLSTLSRLWRIIALSPLQVAAHSTVDAAELRDDRVRMMLRCIGQAEQNRIELLDLLDAVHCYRIPATWGDHDFMVEYDRRRVVKETLLERIITTCVETADAARLLRAEVAAEGGSLPAPPKDAGPNQGTVDEARYSVELFAAILKRDFGEARRCSTHLIAAMAELPLLYVPLAKSGRPRAIVETRVRQRYLQDLLKCLPRLGLLAETCRLIETAREMERANPVGPGAVTEFDELFKIGWKSLVECLVVSAETWGEESEDEPASGAGGSPLVSCLEQFTESLLKSWLAHSRTLRLSVLEKASDKKSWKKLVEFIERYGEDLFSQRFLNLGNLRAILHQGVDSWLTRLQEGARDEIPFRLLDELDGWIPRDEAVERLT